MTDKKTEKFVCGVISPKDKYTIVKREVNGENKYEKVEGKPSEIMAGKHIAAEPKYVSIFYGKNEYKEMPAEILKNILEHQKKAKQIDQMLNIRQKGLSQNSLDKG